MIAKRTISTLLILTGFLCLAGCRHPQTALDATVRPSTIFTPPKVTVAEPKHIEPPRETSANPAIGHLKTRDKLITIRIGSDGPVYTIKTEDGTILAVDLPEKELSAKFPELKDVVERGIADWAGMDLPDQTIERPIDFAPTRSYETTTIIMEHNNDLQLTK